MKSVRCTCTDGIAHIEFGEPEKKNILDVPLLEELLQAIVKAQELRARVIVLQGRGGFWSAGYDIAKIPQELFSRDPTQVARHPFEKCLRAVEECPLPIVAAIQGAALGGALELALTCDLRVASDETKFGLPPARLGLIYSHTGLKKLLRLVGPAEARCMVFTAQTIDAVEAVRIGLINQSVSLQSFQDEVNRWAEQIARGAPLAVQGMKQVLRLLETGESLTSEEVDFILESRQRAFESDDFKEGRVAFAEKRTPRFRGR